MNRFLLQAGSVRSDEDLAEPSRDSAEVEKVPWATIYWNMFLRSASFEGLWRRRERAADQIQEFDGKTRHASGLHGTREGREERGMIQRDAIVQKHISEYGPEFGSDR